ncbi:RNA-binding RNA processing protein rpp1 [Binucleata daphniae]
MLFCDFNINQNFANISDAQSKINKFCKSYAITNDATNTNLQKTNQYTRINIEFDKKISNLTKYKEYDIVSIQVKDFADIKYIIDLSPDLITFNYKQQYIFKPGFVRDAINRGIYFEICTREALYNNLEWLKNVISLLSITNGRGIVVSSGAECEYELKTRYDMFCMLKAFGLSNKRAEKVLEYNANDLLQKCAMKRHSYRGVIAHNEEQGKLKKEYIINKIEKDV